MTLHLDKSQVTSALFALKKHNVITSKDSSLIERQGHFFLTVALKKAAAKFKSSPMVVPLKHPLFNVQSNNTEICLITKDPKAKYEELIQKNGLLYNLTIMSISNLRDNFKSYEEKRSLCHSYDLFLADDRVIPILPKLLGKEFYRKKRLPFPIRITGSNMEKQINKAICSTTYYETGASSFSIKVGYLTQPDAEIMENIIHVMEFLSDHISGRESNIRSVFIKSPSSVALPLYNDIEFSVKPVDNTSNGEAHNMKDELKEEIDNFMDDLFKKVKLKRK